ncbi:DUF4143 domain-containing protein [Collinsella sp. An2]|uniref:ATP-binding protein n=1 Tax=Collinsella sp. An2 TaxID=1965585 RepID=UPI000B3749AC|nr:DUF4143 domain-containing protein [Collinsella sp. An2]OUP11021.1 AAA family ATPase [Collinsella sp. An2]
MARQGIAPEGYLPRVVDEQVERYLEIFGAVEIAGTKWCGKTWTAREHGASVSYVDDDLDLARADPSLMTLGDRPHVIDEWQLVPRIWDVVRRSVDRERGLRGGWILTGSSTPFLRTNKDGEAPSHSGAGRIGRVRMHPMSLFESGDSTGGVSLARLFEGDFEPCLAPDDTRELIDLCCRGGWPEAVGSEVSNAQTLAREYLRLFFTESVPKAGKDADVAARLVASLARNLGQAATYTTIVRDMYGEEDGTSVIAQGTVASYLSLLKASYLIEEYPGWVPPTRSRKRLAVKPKRYLADPSLAAAQLGMAPDALLRDWQTFGLLFESLCMRDLTVYARALPNVGFEPVRYYRDDAGLEADAIIELADGRWAAFEFKVSEDKVADAASSLLRLKRKLCENQRARVREPEFLAVVTGISKYARRTSEGVYVIPIRALRA